MRDSVNYSSLSIIAGITFVLMHTGIYANELDSYVEATYEKCGYCHEYDGNPRMPNFPRLAGQWPQYLQKQLRNFRAHDRIGTMTGTAELLTDEDITTVVTYFNQQTPRRLALPPQSVDEYNTAHHLFSKGDETRKLMACAGCHGIDANGQGLIPALAGQQPDYMKRELRAFKTQQRRNDEASQMRLVAAQLTDKEIEILADYLSRLEPQRADVNNTLPKSAMTGSESTIHLAPNRQN